ncbi:nucleotide sugar dehydrogenase [Marinospirillum perlucidum]|uniref:nucleotide sugar dehydrogenase n=1 Tax=Marinospirillum perlucidum TaxID=1982602 RepID=UPI00138FF426|nr:nucleotide sugar dehydrogenase [Marinospirillum perlucidum]
MKTLILGEDLVAWTLAAALSSTGCRVYMQAGRLPDMASEAVEPDVLVLLEQQLEAGRLSLQAFFWQAAEEGVELLLDARDFVGLDTLLRDIKASGLPALVALVQPAPLGTTEALQEELHALPEASTEVVFWPNFIQAGRALESFTRIEQLLLGSNSEDATLKIKRLMLPFNRSQDRFKVVTPREAELTKLAINGMLATRVSFMNELAQLAASHGVDIEAVRQAMGADTRIGYQYLYPGCGFGGEAFLQTLEQLNRELNSTRPVTDRTASLLGEVQAINDQQKDLLFQKLWRYYRAEVQGRRVALWGCAFKPNTASVSGSPALHLIRVLLEHQVQVVVYDPRAAVNLAGYFDHPEGLEIAESPEEAAQGSDAVLVVTEWKEFWNLDLPALRDQMKEPLLLDGRNIYDPDEMAAAGWIYSGVGRGKVI